MTFRSAFFRLVLGMAAVMALSACSPKFSMFPDNRAALKQIRLSGEGGEKVLLIPVTGLIDSRTRRGFFGSRPSVVEEVSVALEKARQDKDIKAVVLVIETPGGTATGSALLHREILRFKEETGVKVVAAMMNVAASGGYYAAMAADHIVAHPTTVTGSIGTIFLTFNIEGLFDKIGVATEPFKTGKYKDMGSPFREFADDERVLFQTMIDEMNLQFLDAVKKGRPMLTEQELAAVADGRVFTGKQALARKLVDGLGDIHDAVAEARRLAGLPEDASVVVFRRKEFESDSPYNTASNGFLLKALVGEAGFEGLNLIPRSGFYHVWEPGLSR